MSDQDAESLLMPIDAISVKKGMCVLIDGKTCRIADFSASKTGKHGSMKVVLFGTDVFTDAKHQYMSPGHTGLYQVNIVKKEYAVIFVDTKESEVHVLNDRNDTERFPIPEGVLLDGIAKAMDSRDGDVVVTVLMAVETNHAGTSADDVKIVQKVVAYK